jgi:hypothetical protein
MRICLRICDQRVEAGNLPPYLGGDGLTVLFRELLPFAPVLSPLRDF